MDWSSSRCTGFAPRLTIPAIPHMDLVPFVGRRTGAWDHLAWIRWLSPRQSLCEEHGQRLILLRTDFHAGPEPDPFEFHGGDRLEADLLQRMAGSGVLFLHLADDGLDAKPRHGICHPGPGRGRDATPAIIGGCHRIFHADAAGRQHEPPATSRQYGRMVLERPTRECRTLTFTHDPQAGAGLQAA